MKVFSKGYDSGIADASQREHGAVAGYDKIGVCGKGAFKDAIVRFVGEDVERLIGSDQTGVASHPCHDYLKVAVIPVELVTQYPKKFLNDRP